MKLKQYWFYTNLYEKKSVCQEKFEEGQGFGTTRQKTQSHKKKEKGIDDERLMRENRKKKQKHGFGIVEKEKKKSQLVSMIGSKDEKTRRKLGKPGT